MRIVLAAMVALMPMAAMAAVSRHEEFAPKPSKSCDRDNVVIPRLRAIGQTRVLAGAGIQKIVDAVWEVKGDTPPASDSIAIVHLPYRFIGVFPFNKGINCSAVVMPLQMFVGVLSTLVESN